jgi:serine protease Do
MRSLRLLSRCGLLLTLVWLLSLGTALAQIPDLGTGRVPTLAPLVKEVTPAVVNISVQGKIREDNPSIMTPSFVSSSTFRSSSRRRLTRPAPA